MTVYSPLGDGERLSDNLCCC
ncbi:MAG: hypothetical protein QOF32_2278, partial [Gammaproteobacteria bacterium]|nr:hypothetical protein [Gammaproteobacteria bacterium]